MSEPAISLRGVSKRYRDTVALEPLDLDIQDGEFFCLNGPSGCGKTTTLNLIGGFVQVSSGEIFIEGKRADPSRPTSATSTRCFRTTRCSPTSACTTTSASA
jgi:ABC-type Fe3+/spermidine/putrescine transport system ATPase subunit